MLFIFSIQFIILAMKRNLKIIAMNLSPKFYESNPFLQPKGLRVEGAAQMDTERLYALFVKNLIAYVFYEDSFYFYDAISERGIKTLNDSSQPNLYHVFLRGCMMVGSYPNQYSPVKGFSIFETKIFSKDLSSDGLAYHEFICDNIAVFERIDLLVSLQIDEKAGSNFLSYLTAYNAIYPHINVTLIGNVLEQFFIYVCKELAVSYIYHLDESNLFPEDFEYAMDTILFSMKYDLLEKEEQERIVTFCKRWITQRFKEFSMKSKIRFAIYEDKGPYLFGPVLQYFSEFFSDELPSTVSKEYPTHIFKNYEGFYLFDTLAKGLYVKTSISYVYRLFFEKGLIVVKDTPFRTWYNQQSYPIQLATVTDTLQKATSSDREQFVAIVAKLLNVTI